MAGNGPNGNGKGAPNLTEEQREVLMEALEDGVPIIDALMAAGVSRTTFYRLKDRALAASKGALKEWWNTIECARAKGAVVLWRRAAKGGKGSGGAMWVLEHSYGYWKTERQEIEAKTETRGVVEHHVLERVPPREEKPEKKKPKEGPDDGE